MWECGTQSETYAHHKGVDGGGYAEKDHGGETSDIEGFIVFVVMECVPNHLASDDEKESESHPVVDGGNKILEGSAEKGSQEGEQTLTEAENNGHLDAFAPRHLALEGAGGGNDQGVDT